MRMQQRALSQAFWDWLDGMGVQKQTRYILQRALGKLMNRVLSEAFCSWFDVASSSRENIIALVKGEQFLLGLFNRTMRSAYIQWVSVCEEANHQRRLIRKSLMRISQRVLVDAFDDWLLILEEKRAAEAVQRRLERAILFMSNRAMHMAFGRWLEYAFEAQKQRSKISRVIVRLQNVKLSASYHGWADAVLARRIQRGKVRKAMGRILSRTCSKTFVRWLEQVEKMKHMRSILSRSLKKMTLRHLAAAFTSWAEVVEEKRLFDRGALQTSRFLLALMKRRHRAVFSGWLWQVQELKRQRLLVRKSLGRMLQRHTAAVFDTWVTEVHRSQRKLASHAKVNETVAHMMNRALGIAFYRWLDMARNLRSKRSLVEKIVIRMEKKALVLTFSHWSAYAYEHRVMANKVRKVIGRWQGVTVFTTLRQWRGHVELLKSRRTLIRKVIMRWEHQTLAKSFLAWSTTGQLARSRRTLVGKLLARSTSRSMQMFFMSWREMARQRIDIQEGHLLYAIPRILAVKKRCSFKIWTRYIRKVKGQRNRAKKVGQELTAHAFTTWRLHTSLKVRVLEESKLVQERKTHTQLLDTAYDKVLRECEALEEKVMNLESQRDSDFSSFEFGKPGVRGRVEGKETEDTMDILQQLRDENRLLQSEMSSLLDSDL